MSDELGLRDERYGSFLAERRAAIVGLLGEACARAGRDPSEVTLLAVSKTVGVTEVVQAVEAGYEAFGENRPQELVRKTSALQGIPGLSDLRFDMIGNLQKNKINQVLGCAELVHSVSSEHLAEAISRRALARGMRCRALMEVNVTGEASKSGFSPSEALECIERLCALEGIALEGTMTMAPAGDPNAARRAFSGLRELTERLRALSGLQLTTLSCGMSDDFQIAVEEGSTLVRLGRTVFDPDYVLS